MGGNKIIQFSLIGLALFIGVAAVINSLGLPDRLILSLLIGGVVFIGLTTIKRNLPLDFKLIALLLCGYAAAGKGFAYISPFEPLYIGELILILSLIGWAIRILSKLQLFPTKLHWYLFGWMVTVGIYLIYAFPEYGKLALRDSAIGYYALFFFFLYGVCQKEAVMEAFPKVLLICCTFAYLGSAFVSSGLYDKVMGNQLIARRFILPHADSLIPLVAGGALYGLLQGVSKRSISALGFGLCGIILLGFTKTAGIFCLLVGILFFLIAGKRKDLLITSFVGTLLAIIMVGIVIASGSNVIQDKIKESDQFQTLHDLGGASGYGNTSTSDWRISWWKIVFRDTIREDPWTGIGLGGDITTSFLSEVMRLDLRSEQALNYARYPHNVVFTVFGRMGAVGLSIFSIVFLNIFLFLARFAKTCLREQRQDAQPLLAAAVFISGFSNSLVQSTYENPYAAILNWSCLGFLAAYYRKVKTLGTAEAVAASKK